MFVKGRIIQMLFVLLSIVSTYLYIKAVEKGRNVNLRPIAGFDKIDEAVGRSTEMGRPVHFTPGYSLGGLYNPSMGPQNMAGLSTLKKVAKSCAERGASLIVTLNQPEAVSLVDEIIKNAYDSENQENPVDSTRFISTEQMAYAAGVLGVLREDRPAASILMGFFWAESLIFAEGGNYIGAFQIAGTAEASQIPFFVAACDYVVIGEELYAAKAYIENDVSTLGSLLSQDLIRTILLAVMFLIFIGSNFKINWIIDLIRM